MFFPDLNLFLLCLLQIIYKKQTLQGLPDLFFTASTNPRTLFIRLLRIYHNNFRLYSVFIMFLTDYNQKLL